MADFLLELYLPGTREHDVARYTARARAAADALARSGTPVRCVGSIFVAEDETCFLLYEAESASAVEAAARRARLAFDRVAEARASGVKD